MRTIWKFDRPLSSLDDVIHIEMPRGAKVLSVGNQNGKLAIWAEVDTDYSHRTETRRFRVAGTGHPLNETCRFIGTVQFESGSLVFHIYEMT